MAETGNNRKSFNFTYISYYVFGNCLIDFPKIWGKLSILGPKLMCHYLSYFSAPAVRIFLNVVQWKWPRGRSKFCKWLSQNILVCSKWDILDQKSHVPLDLLPLAPTPLMKKPGISKKNSHQKKWRRLSRNYTLNWKSCWRKISKVYFFCLWWTSQAFAITWCHPPSVSPVPHYPLPSVDPHMKLSPKT